MKISAAERRPFGKTGLSVPPIVFGSSALGNLYRAIPDQAKFAICREWFEHVAPPVVVDTAGKYGAGLALEVLGEALRRLDIGPDELIISNKLGWKRAPLRGAEPEFEPGVWMGLEHDAEQVISYDGILECWEEGCRLLGGQPQLVSVHDPDEYLAAARSPAERDRRFQDILDAYRALGELKAQGRVRGVGIGSKDWHVIRDIDERVPLDWVMLANSLTIMRHPPELLDFVACLTERQVAIINSAVFHAGFLAGGKYFDYRVISPDNDEDRKLFAWRKSFVVLCEAHGILPAEACVQFGLSPPGVLAVSLNTSHPDRVAENVDSVLKKIPHGFWASMKEEGLIAADYPYVGV